MMGSDKFNCCVSQPVNDVADDYLCTFKRYRRLPMMVSVGQMAPRWFIFSSSPYCRSPAQMPMCNFHTSAHDYDCFDYYRLAQALHSLAKGKVSSHCGCL